MIVAPSLLTYPLVCQVTLLLSCRLKLIGKSLTGGIVDLPRALKMAETL